MRVNRLPIHAHPGGWGRQRAAWTEAMLATWRWDGRSIAAGTALRYSAGAVVAVTGMLILPTFLGPLLGSWQRPVTGATPAAALQKLSTDATATTLGGPGAWATLGLVAAYSLATLAAAGWLLHRRDS